MKLFKLPLIILCSCLLNFSFANAKPMQYTPGLLTTVGSDGLLSLGYQFGHDALNQINLGISYSDAKMKGGLQNTTFTNDHSNLPVMLDYVRYFPVKAKQLNNQLFFGLKPWYLRDFGSEKTTSSTSGTKVAVAKEDWSAGLDWTLEWRLNTYISYGLGVSVYSHNRRSLSGIDGSITQNEYFSGGFAYASYKF